MVGIRKKIPEEYLKARIFLLFKKGNSANIENYRPISLLNTITKMFASILKTRIADGIDNLLHKTQYGFRKKKSTTHALLIVRRLIDKGERTNKHITGRQRIQLLLLDWEKAFDKLTHAGFFSALERKGVPDALLCQPWKPYIKIRNST